MAGSRTRTFVFLLICFAIAALATRGWKCFDWPLSGDEFHTLNNSVSISFPPDPSELSSPVFVLCPLSFYLNQPLTQMTDNGGDPFKRVLAKGLVFTDLQDYKMVNVIFL